jgi:hypothetical protein
MEIKGTWRRDFEHRLLFTGLDIDVMRSVVRERQHHRAEEQGGLDVIPDTETTISRWDNTSRRKIIFANDLGEISGWLDEFAARTDEEVVEIPEVTFRPAFDNELITRRTLLGQHALAMSGQLKSKEMAGTSISEISDEEFEAGVTNILNKAKREGS